MDKLLFGLLFILPFIISPIGLSPFEAPKVYVAEIGISVLLLWYLLKYPLRSLIEPRNKLLGGLGILGIIGAVHVFLSPSPILIFGNPFRMSGVFVFELLLLLAFLSSRISLPLPSSKLVTILLSLQLIAVMVIQTKVDSRAIGTLGEANSLAAYVVFLLPFLFFSSFSRNGESKNLDARFSHKGISHFIASRKNDMTKSIGIFVGISIILFSGSRSGVIALLIFCVFYLIQRFSLKPAVFISFFLFVVSLTLPFLQQNQLFENRTTVWQTAVGAGLAKPMLGWGPGNTEIALRETAKKIGNALQYEYVDHSHNIFLEYGVIGGVIGLAAFVSLVLSAFVSSYRRKRPAEFVALLGLITMLSFNPLSIAIMLQFWWLIGRSMLQKTEEGTLGNDR